MKLYIKQIEHHRNGISGNGFWAVLFGFRDGRKMRRMVATVFEEAGNCAVLEVDKLSGEHGVGFGWNSWRGDHFEDKLRLAIQEKETKTSPRPIS